MDEKIETREINNYVENIDKNDKKSTIKTQNKDKIDKNNKNIIKKDGRKSAQRLLLTIDQIGQGENKSREFSLQDLELKIKEKYADKITYCCIARESHQNKGWHCHIFLHFKERFRFRLDKNPFNYLYDKPVNIKVIKNTYEDKVRVLNYVKKAQDYIDFGVCDIGNKQENIGNIKKYVIKAIQEGINLYNLLNHEIKRVRDYCLDHSKKIKHMIYEIENLKHEMEIRKLKGIEKIDVKKVKLKEWKEIIKILNNAQNKRDHKSLNLHIWSEEPNMGKTSFVNKIMEYSASYIFPPDGWFTRYNNYVYDFIIWDEVTFRGLHPTFLNLFLEGSKCQMPVKGDLTHKWDNPLVIMISNKPIREHLKLIKNEEDRVMFEKTLLVRVKEIKITKPLFNLRKLITPRKDF